LDRLSEIIRRATVRGRFIRLIQTAAMLQAGATGFEATYEKDQEKWQISVAFIRIYRKRNPYREELINL
jgi:hypothetical protein